MSVVPRAYLVISGKPIISLSLYLSPGGLTGLMCLWENHFNAFPPLLAVADSLSN